MPRGGRRRGAGAPKGNLNALRTGARSKQVKAVMLALLTVPEVRRVLLHLRRLEDRRLDLTDAINGHARLARRVRSGKARSLLAARIAAWLRETRPSTAPPAHKKEQSIKQNEESADSDARSFRSTIRDRCVRGVQTSDAEHPAHRSLPYTSE